MRFYLDNSFLNRPFDERDIPTHVMESEVLFWILELTKQGTVILINSSLVEYENSLNPFPERKMFIEEVMGYAEIYQNVDEQMEKRADRLHRIMNLRPASWSE